MPSPRPVQTVAMAATAAGAAAFGFALAAPADAGLITSFSPYETRSAHPTAGAKLDTRLITASGTIPVAWNTALIMGNGGWEMGLASAVVSSPPTSIVRFDTLSPWARAKLPTLWGVPLALIAGATIPAATGSAAMAGLGVGATFQWDGDTVDVNLGARLNPGGASLFSGVALSALFTHPLGKDFAGNAEIVFRSDAGTNVMIERLGFTRTWSDDWASDVSVTLNTPLGGTAPLTVAPSLGLTYTF